MRRETFANVWRALEPTEADAVNMTIRSQLMTSIEEAVAAWNVPQGEAAKRLAITRPRLNDLLRGKISKFSLDALATLATRAGLSVRMSVKKARMKARSDAHPDNRDWAREVPREREGE